MQMSQSRENSRAQWDSGAALATAPAWRQSSSRGTYRLPDQSHPRHHAPEKTLGERVCRTIFQTPSGLVSPKIQAKSELPGSIPGSHEIRLHPRTVAYGFNPGEG